MGPGEVSGGLRGTGPAPRFPQAKVIRSRSTRCLSFPLAVTTFLASSCWTLYGQLVKDKYITVGWGQREAGGCCGFPPLLSSPFQRGAWHRAGPRPASRVSHSRARD